MASTQSITDAAAVKDVNGDGEYNFMLMLFTQDKSEKTVVRADLSSRKRHHDLVNNALLEFPRTWHVRRHPLGGGMLTYNKKDKQIVVHGKADMHGREPDRSITLKILGDAFPGFEIISRD